MHQEARIERHGAVGAVDQDGVGMAAKTSLPLEQVDAVPAAQQRGRGQTGNAAADDRD